MNDDPHGWAHAPRPSPLPHRPSRWLQPDEIRVLAKRGWKTVHVHAYHIFVNTFRSSEGLFHGKSGIEEEYRNVSTKKSTDPREILRSFEGNWNHRDARKRGLKRESKKMFTWNFGNGFSRLFGFFNLPFFSPPHCVAFCRMFEICLRFFFQPFYLFLLWFDSYSVGVHYTAATRRWLWIFFYSRKKKTKNNPTKPQATFISSRLSCQRVIFRTGYVCGGVSLVLITRVRLCV